MALSSLWLLTCPCQFMNQARSVGLKTMPWSSEFSVPVTSIHKIEADGVRVFYRAAGDPNPRSCCCCTGSPHRSFMFRGLIPRLASDYYVIAPDLPASGSREFPRNENTSIPSTGRPLRSMPSLKRSRSSDLHCMYSIMVRPLDSAWRWLIPIGSRPSFHRMEMPMKRGLAMRGDRSGNTRAEPTLKNREVLRQNILTFEGTRWQYTWC